VHDRLSAFRRAAAWAAMLAASVLTTTTHAQEAYPAHQVRVIVPYSPGGGSDIVTRVFAEKLSGRTGKTFLVENRAGGAAGTVGSHEIVVAKPDGYTLGVNTVTGLATAAMDPAGFNPLRDLDPVARLGSTTMMVVVNPKLPIHSIADLVAYAKAHPGLAYGSSGTGGIMHFTTARFARAAGVEMTHVPYRGELPALNDVIAGVTPVVFCSVAIGKPFVASGQVRALAVTSGTRFPTVPQLPTLKELGYTDVVADVFYGLYVTKGTPAAVVDTLVRNVNALRADPQTSSRLLDQLSFSTTGSDTPALFRQDMEKEYARFSALAADLKLLGTKDR
jgi:tripartite-type tricarboxylate transporter receptor subunit TctC